MAMIELEDITKRYEKSGAPIVHALRGVSLAIGRGELVAIAGASGSGKSTLMNVLGCLDRPTKGTYMLDGIEISKLDRNELADPHAPRGGRVEARQQPQERGLAGARGAGDRDRLALVDRERHGLHDRENMVGCLDLFGEALGPHNGRRLVAPCHFPQLHFLP